MKKFSQISSACITMLFMTTVSAAAVDGFLHQSSSASNSTDFTFSRVAARVVDGKIEIINDRYEAVEAFIHDKNGNVIKRIVVPGSVDSNFTAALSAVKDTIPAAFTLSTKPLSDYFDTGSAMKYEINISPSDFPEGAAISYVSGTPAAIVATVASGMIKVFTTAISALPSQAASDNIKASVARAVFDKAVTDPELLMKVALHVSNGQSEKLVGEIIDWVSTKGRFAATAAFLEKGFPITKGNIDDLLKAGGALSLNTLELAANGLVATSAFRDSYFAAKFGPSVLWYDMPFDAQGDLAAAGHKFNWIGTPLAQKSPVLWENKRSEKDDSWNLFRQYSAQYDRFKPDPDINSRSTNLTIASPPNQAPPPSTIPMSQLAQDDLKVLVPGLSSNTIGLNAPPLATPFTSTGNTPPPPSVVFSGFVPSPVTALTGSTNRGQVNGNAAVAMSNAIFSGVLPITISAVTTDVAGNTYGIGFKDMSATNVKLDASGVDYRLATPVVFKIDAAGVLSKTDLTAAYVHPTSSDAAIALVAGAIKVFHTNQPQSGVVGREGTVTTLNQTTLVRVGIPQQLWANADAGRFPVFTPNGGVASFNNTGSLSCLGSSCTTSAIMSREIQEAWIGFASNGLKSSSGLETFSNESSGFPLPRLSGFSKTVAVGGAGTANTVGHSYMTWGQWNDSLGQVNQKNFDGAWLAGQLTNGAAIPTTGSATFNGVAIGTANFGGTPSIPITGGHSAAVNFSTRTVVGSISNLTGPAAVNQSIWLANATYSASWRAGQNQILGSVITASVPLTGAVAGGFFGPTATELGGRFVLTKANGQQATGIFTGKR